MSICAVNGQDYEAFAGLTTWGQLLDALEQGVGGERVVVTAVRFGGVDQPSFRETDELSRGIEDGTHIDVDISQARVLVEEAVETALNGLGPLGHAAQRTADAFRSHDLADAHSRLADVVITLQTLTKLTAAIGQGGLAPRTARTDDDREALLERLGQNLETLITAAMNEDWTSVADVLEYDMADLLPSWQAVLRALVNPESWADVERGLPVGLRCV